MNLIFKCECGKSKVVKNTRSNYIELLGYACAHLELGHKTKGIEKGVNGDLK